MHKILQLSILVILSVLISMPLFAYEKKLNDILNSKELKKISSAEKLIAKGDAIIKQTEVLEIEIEKLKNANGRVKTGKINKCSKQIAEKKVKASLYYKDGYKKYIDVLDNRLKILDKSGNFLAKEIRNDIKVLEKKARKQYNKAENLSSPEKTIELLELAQENQKKAIDLQKKCILSLSKTHKEEPVLVAEQTVKDSTSIAKATVSEQESTNPLTTNKLSLLSTDLSNGSNATTTTGALAVSTAAVVVDPFNETNKAAPSEITQSEMIREKSAPANEPVEEALIENQTTNAEVFLTIQFMADKKKATDAQISSIYSGNKEVIEMNISNWYKYSVGRYKSIEEAQADMKAENIKGFIVAYYKKQRISVKKAVSLLNEYSL